MGVRVCYRHCAGRKINKYSAYRHENGEVGGHECEMGFTDLDGRIAAANPISRERLEIIESSIHTQTEHQGARYCIHLVN